MVQFIPPPSPRNLLPPLLACLPTAFASPRAPPALLPLLSPILRQRVQLLSATFTSTSDSWLPLLCWEKGPSEKLVDIVTESDAYELHPVSGEIDYGELDPLQYRRLDEETIQTRVAIPSLELVVIYLWCQNDAEGGGSGWRVSEVRPAGEEPTDSTPWHLTIAVADDMAKITALDAAFSQGEQQSVANGIPTITNGVHGEPAHQNANNNAKNNNESTADDDDDNYWSRYVNTPAGRTPALETTPSIPSSPTSRKQPTSEAEYYARYADIQPEMDAQDPDQQQNAAVDGSTLNGDTMGLGVRGQQHHQQYVRQQPNGLMININDDDNSGTSTPAGGVRRARPTFPSSMEKPERTAEVQSLAEVAIKQHVSMSVKNLFRLCRSSGMAVEEFDEMVRTELGMLTMLAEEDSNVSALSTGP